MNTPAIKLDTFSDNHDIHAMYRTTRDAHLALQRWLLQAGVGRLVWVDEYEAMSLNGDVVITLSHVVVKEAQP